MLVSEIEREKRLSIFPLHWKLKWFPLAQASVKIEVFHHGKEHSKLKRKLKPLFIRNWSHCCVSMEVKQQNTFWIKDIRASVSQSHAGIEKSKSLWLHNYNVEQWIKAVCVARTLIALLQIHQHFLIDNECHKKKKSLCWIEGMRAEKHHAKGVNKQHLYC